MGHPRHRGARHRRGGCDRHHHQFAIHACRGGWPTAVGLRSRGHSMQGVHPERSLVLRWEKRGWSKNGRVLRLVGLAALRQPATLVKRLVSLGLTASLCLGARAPWVSPEVTGARLLVHVGFDWKDQACWPPGTSGVVSLTATPVSPGGLE